MNRPCPRCGQNLIVHARGPATVTCPVCLASIPTGSKPLPMPPLPMRAIALEYEIAGGDIEQELAKDMRWALYGIATFAGGTILGFGVLIVYFEMRIPAKYWLTAVAVVTSIAAAGLLAQQSGRGARYRSGKIRPRSTDERVVALVAMGLGGVIAIAVMAIITGIALVILVLLVCFGGVKI
jgi:hypothetical protein